MCKQPKTGFAGCAHVYTDGDIEPCQTAIEAAKTIRPLHEEGNTFCEHIEWEWKEKRVSGKCYWCWEMMAESPRRTRKREKLLGVKDKVTGQATNAVIAGSTDEVMDGVVNGATNKAMDEATNGATGGLMDWLPNEVTDGRGT